MSGTRIPVGIEEYHNYITSSNNLLLQPSPAPLTVTNWVRYNWLSSEQTAWASFAARDAVLWLLWNDKAQRPPNVTKQYYQLIQDTHDFDKDNHSLDRIAAGHPSLMNIHDYTTFNIQHNIPVPNKGLPTERQTATTRTVYYSSLALGNGDMKFACRSDIAAERAHILKGYEVEIFYLILANADVSTTPPTPADLVPTSVVALTQHTTSTHAHFTLHLGGDASNHRMAVSMRWKHKTNPALNGPLSPIQMLVIN
jgi:hypothetical protein